MRLADEKFARVPIHRQAGNSQYGGTDGGTDGGSGEKRPEDSMAHGSLLLNGLCGSCGLNCTSLAEEAEAHG